MTHTLINTVTQVTDMKSVLDVIDDAQKLVIVQADNPDGDSLASALALEEILGDIGKDVVLYCGVDIPSYLRYLEGWARVTKDMPRQFDASIIVDTSSETLLEKASETGNISLLKSKPCLVIDHHGGNQTISFAATAINAPVVATGEIIYELATRFNWPLNHTALTMIATSIMADSRGLTSDKTTARSIHIIAELVEKGVSIPEMEAARRAMMRKPTTLIHYKGELLQRTEYYSNERVAVITIPWEEIEKYSHAYNPTMLVMDDMLMAEHTCVAIGFKVYRDGKVTAKIRANHGSPVAIDIAQHFGGGGHPYASGFKVTDGRTFKTIKQECLRVTAELLAAPNSASQKETHV